MAKKGYYTLKRTCTVYYRTEDQAFEPETLKEAKQNANDADLSDLGVNWIESDWQVDGEVGQWWLRSTHICDWVDRVKEAHWYETDPVASMKYKSIKENKKHG